MLHLVLHALVPALVAAVFFRNDWLKAWLWMLATMLVDIDHLLATPIYDPGRCSINFHPLHGFVPIALYLVLALVPTKLPATRYIGLGLLIHMALDSIDCQVTNGVWFTPFAQ